MQKTYHISIVVLAIVMSSCKTGTESESAEVRNFTTIHLPLCDTSLTKEFSARIESIQNIEIRSQITGILDHIYVDEGQQVSEGQKLFSISSQLHLQELAKAHAAVLNAESALSAAQLELENAEKLAGKQIISTSELRLQKLKLDGAKANLEEAKNNEEQAKINLSFTEVRAPFSGMINRLELKRGSLIESGTLLTTLSDNSSIYAYYNVSELEYLQYNTNKNDQKLRQVGLKLANGDMYDQKGTIEAISSEFDPNTGNIAFRAKFSNPNNLLKHGATGKIVTSEIIDKVYLVPQKSTFEIQGQHFIYVIENTGIARQTAIHPIGNLPNYYLIKQEIMETQEVLLDGIQHVKANEQIQATHVSFSVQSN
jgi:RND family efflux transporter MFP subunit